MPNDKQHGNSLFTPEQVIRIRQLVREGVAPREIAKFYQVGLETVRRMIRRDTFDWLPETLEEWEAQQVTVQSQAKKTSEDAQASLAKLLAENPDLIEGK